MSNDTRTQLEEERRSVAVAIWQEDSKHESANVWEDLEEWERADYLRQADAAIKSSALPMRNAQVSAVLRELNIPRSEPRDDFDRGADMARRWIRRAIEEAGA